MARIDMSSTVFARDNGSYIGLYTNRSGRILCGAVWKNDKRCLAEWEDIKKTHNIEWI